MNNTIGTLIVIAIGVAIVAAIFSLIIPEPDQRAVITSERLDVAVLAFGNSSAWSGVGDTLRTRIETRLVNTTGITVFSRTQLDALLTEQALGEVGILDQSTAVRIGSLTGVNKLVAGSVYGIETRTEETSVCVEWKDGECIQSVPATRYTVKVLAQIQVMNAHTGQIEQARDMQGTASALVKQGISFAGYETLIADATDDIASDVASLLISVYTRELRYGLYRSYEKKRSGYIGKDETSHFHPSDGKAYLIVHFTRVRRDDTFDLSWTDPQGNVIKKVEDIVSGGEWRLYPLDLSGLSDGRYAVNGTLNGIKAFEKAFMVSP